MKKVISIFFAFLISLSYGSFGKVPKTPKRTMQKQSQRIVQSELNIISNRAVLCGKIFRDEYWYSATRASKLLTNYFDASKTIKDSINSISCNYLKKYEDFIVESFFNLGDQYVFKNSFTPSCIKYYGQDCIVFNDMYCKFSYNTIQTDKNSRAKQTFDEICSNAFSRIGKTEIKNAPKYIGVTMCFISGDFTDKYQLYDYEYLFVVSELNDIRKLSNLELSPTQFANKAYCIYGSKEGNIKMDFKDK